MTDTGRAIRRIVLIAFLTAILETAKFALNAIANVELITLLIIIFTRRFGTRMMLAVCLVFTMLECMWWGISIWTVTYFYVWPILVLLVHMFRKMTAALSASARPYPGGSRASRMTLSTVSPTSSSACCCSDRSPRPWTACRSRCKSFD